VVVAKGVIQGYTGAAAVDASCQIIVAAQAHGSGSEQSLLMPMVEQAAPFAAATTIVTADAGYHSEANLKQLHDKGMQALIADGLSDAVTHDSGIRPSTRASQTRCITRSRPSNRTPAASFGRRISSTTHQRKPAFARPARRSTATAPTVRPMAGPIANSPEPNAIVRLVNGDGSACARRTRHWCAKSRSFTKPRHRRCRTQKR
jgi:hypothetical protein